MISVDMRSHKQLNISSYSWLSVKVNLWDENMDNCQTKQHCGRDLSITSKLRPRAYSTLVYLTLNGP